MTWNAKGVTTEIKTARSRDGGRTFVDERSLQAKGALGDRGWQASAVDARGALHTIWLDHRAMAASKAAGDHSEHKGEHDGVAMAQKSALYYAADGAAERELFKGVCYCCKTAMAIGPGGEIFAAWRHVFPGNMRDMGFTMSRDGGKTFTPLARVNQDGWSIQGCPDDGPAMAVDAKGTVHLVWPTVKNEQGVILYATSKNGAAFSTPVRLPTLGGPKPSHPQVDGRSLGPRVRGLGRGARRRPPRGDRADRRIEIAGSPRRDDVVSGDGAQPTPASSPCGRPGRRIVRRSASASYSEIIW